MAELMPVPEVAAGAAEVVISEWLVKPGDQVAAGAPVAVIETDKAVVEVEAENDATLLRILAEAGSHVAVGAPLALLGTAAEANGDIAALLAALGVSADVANGPNAAAHAETPIPPPTITASPRTFISPLARKMLKQAGLSADGVSGTGPGGRIRRRDVEAAISAARNQIPTSPAEQPAVAAPAEPEAVTPVTTAPVTSTSVTSAPVTSAPSQGPWTETPHSRLRRAIANRLTQSKRDIPHFYLKRTIRLDALLALRTQLNQASPVKLSVNDLIIRAIAVAHTTVPEANVIWTDEALRQFDTVDISVAIASDRGLVTPVLRDVEKSSLSAISTQVKTFVEQANTGRLQQKDLEGGSIAISNLGMYGIDEFAAIINPPQSAILAVGAARPTVQAVDGQPAVATTADFVLSVDHRAIDGALAAQWMAALVDALETPIRLVV
jgi:pyruvate dehydrogenase E2 component (dihydrolipoamide acetyltransferase)